MGKYIISGLLSTILLLLIVGTLPATFSMASPTMISNPDDSPASPPPPGPITGRVLLNGVPQEHAKVELLTEDGVLVCSASTDLDGTFEFDGVSIPLWIVYVVHAYYGGLTAESEPFIYGGATIYLGDLYLGGHPYGVQLPRI